MASFYASDLQLHKVTPVLGETLPFRNWSPGIYNEKPASEKGCLLIEQLVKL